MQNTILTGAPASDPGAADLVKDTTTKDFIADVVEASKSALVLVDFWAPWCGPCRQLTPVLEKIVRGIKGKVRLVKLNIDEHPAVPGQMGVQSIPAVFAFRDGRPVDGFMGALPEGQVKSFIERILGIDGAPDITADLNAAEIALAEGDAQGAAQLFAMTLQDDPGNARALGGIARCYLNAGELDRADQTLQLAPPDKSGDAAIQSARAALELARKTAKAGDPAALRKKVDADPSDHQARYDLALALEAHGDRAGAADALLTIIGADQAWRDEAARKQLLELFEAWGPKEPATAKGRQRLSALLFS